MIKDKLEELFLQSGYQKLPTNLPEITVFYHMENNYVNLLHMIDYRVNMEFTKEQAEHVREKIRTLFLEKGFSDIHMLSLILSAEAEKAKNLCSGDPFCWIVSTEQNRLIIYENQVNDFYGMKGLIERILESDMTIQGKTASIGPGFSQFKLTEIKKLPYVTITLVALNIIIFLICSFTGERLYDWGSFSLYRIYPGIGHEYYTFFTSLFLHGDVNHIFSNMLILYYIGIAVEKYFGHLAYGILYFAAGAGGNLLSMCNEYFTGQFSFSIGASGAIFGVIGALLVLVIVHKGHFEQITLGRLLFMIAYSLYSGFVGTNINNAAHIGGFVSGMAVAAVLWLIIYRKRFKKFS